MAHFTPFNIKSPFSRRGPGTRSEQYLELVFEASLALASTLDLEQTLKTVAQMAVPQLADWCVVDLIEKNGDLNRLITAHNDPKMVEIAHEFFQAHPPNFSSSAGIPRVARTGETEVVFQVTDNILRSMNMSEIQLKAAREFKIRSGISVPLKSGKKILGVMTFIYAESEREYTSEDVFWAEEIGRRAAVAVENSLNYQHEQKQRMNAEKELSLLAEVVRNMPAGIIIAEAPSGKLILGNAEVQKIFRHPFKPTETFEQYSLWNGFKIDGTPFSSDDWQLARSIKNGERIVGEEMKIKRGDSTYGVLSVSSAPIYNRDGRIIAGVCAFIDITEKKNNENELRIAKEAAESASLAKTRFLANMSHEIRTPLGVITGHLDLLLSGKQSEAERLEALQVMKRNADLLENLIEDLLDLSRVETGKLRIEKVSFFLPNLIGDVLSVVKLKAEEKGLELSFRFMSDVPNEIISDPTRIKQILINVLGNAVKFTDKGSVSISVDYAKPYLSFKITDSGRGISSGEAARLFQPFTQVDNSATRRFGGTGLGLALSRRLAQSLGGELVLERSIPDQGTTFAIRLPIEEGLNSVPIHELRSEMKTFSAPQQKLNRLTNVKVLLVDDSADNRLLVSKLLKIEGALVETADDGAEGVLRALDGDHDIVLMDIQMPRMDGHEAVQNLRSAGYNKPIIALTAHAFQEERDRSLRLGFNDHLTKPIPRNDLVERIRTLTHH